MSSLEDLTLSNKQGSGRGAYSEHSIFFVTYEWAQQAEVLQLH